MKNIKRILAILLVVMMSFGVCALVACEPDDLDPDNTPSKLATPVVTISDSGLASWGAVANATGYKYKINNGADVTTDKLSVQLADGDSIVVKAVGNGDNYTDSDYSASKTYTEASNVEPTAQKLATPVVSIDADGKATWQAVANASGYKYKIDDGDETAVAANGTLEVVLEEGESIRVKAVGDGVNYTDSDYSAAKTFAIDEKWYETNADVVEDGTVRYMVYTTNKTSGSTDNVIAVKKAQKSGSEWTYGDRNVAVEGGNGKWDAYIGSASIVKGTFGMGSETYSWLIAYSASAKADETANQIGLAVAKDPMGAWVKVDAEAPLIEYDAAQYGERMAGCYAPSLVNYNRTSGIRLFYTYADKYGHFARFFDADMSNLENIDGQYQNYVTPEGNYDGERMFPNADWAYDATNHVFYAVKDSSPTPATVPSFADQFEIMYIAENELYEGNTEPGWVSIEAMNDISLNLGSYDDDNDFARAYSACIVADAYGHMIDNANIETVFTTCIQGSNYRYTQVLKTYVCVVTED